MKAKQIKKFMNGHTVLVNDNFRIKTEASFQRL